MKISDHGFLSMEQFADRYLAPSGKTQDTPRHGAQAQQTPVPELSFQEILDQKTIERQTEAKGLKFSKHAAGRLADRNIELTAGQVERLEDGTRRAEGKGIRDSLVLMDGLAFIVNVPNRTVVTAMDYTNRAQAAENIFTNIDGAVIA
ncbi:MAG: flagellar protein [Clostridium sp.]|jgi:flagellar operon protein|nr:flagellar protein [Clostridium sp.]